MNKKKSEINEAQMLEKIRSLLNLSIKNFVAQMNWPNSKYYDYIKNGRTRPGNKNKKKTHPTIYKIFMGINYAISTFSNWKQKRRKIIRIIINYLLPNTPTPNKKCENKKTTV